MTSAAPEEIRSRSRQLARSLGYPRPPEDLAPPEVRRVRSRDELVERALVLNVVISSAYGLEPAAALAWLRQERLLDSLFDDEREFLADVSEGLHVEDVFRKLQVEALWALLWALSLVDELDFDRGCGAGVIGIVPDIEDGEDSGELRAAVQQREARELYEAYDLATCLAWAIGDPDLQVGFSPGDVEPYVVWERRRALAWIHGTDW
jgi:hypothetical protein